MQERDSRRTHTHTHGVYSLPKNPKENSVDTSPADINRRIDQRQRASCIEAEKCNLVRLRTDGRDQDENTRTNEIQRVKGMVRIDREWSEPFECYDSDLK